MKAFELSYIAFYNGKKTTFSASSLYQAKQIACRDMNVPKSKRGLVAVMLQSEYNREAFRSE